MGSFTTPACRRLYSFHKSVCGRSSAAFYHHTTSPVSPISSTFPNSQPPRLQKSTLIHQPNKPHTDTSRSPTNAFTIRTPEDSTTSTAFKCHWENSGHNEMSFTLSITFPSIIINVLLFSYNCPLHFSLLIIHPTLRY